MQSLGDLALVAHYARNLLERSAKEWFWRYHKIVQEVTRPGLKAALRAQFQDGRSDLEIRSEMFQRKQRPN